MGLQETVKQAAQAAFTAIGDLARYCTYHPAGATTYNPATGAVTEGSSTNETVDAVFAKYSAYEIGSGIAKVGDQKILIPVENLTATPKVEDYITEGGTRWNVLSVSTDPAKALWILQARTA